LLLLKAYDNHDRPARAELHARSRAHLRRLHDAPPVEESAEAGIGVNQQAAPVLETKLGVLARDHRPFGLVENDVTLSRVASNLDGSVVVSALRLYGLPVALFYQNDFHDGYLKLNTAEEIDRIDMINRIRAEPASSPGLPFLHNLVHPVNPVHSLPVLILSLSF
jgi:hypothetical protein